MLNLLLDLVVIHKLRTPTATNLSKLFVQFYVDLLYMTFGVYVRETEQNSG